MKNRGDYFKQAQHFVSEKFFGVDGFNNFTDSTNYVSNVATEGVNMHQYNPTTSAPYEVDVANANTVATQAIIWNAYSALTASNNGNVSGITITSAIPNVTYQEMLSQSMHKNFEVGMTYIQVVSGSNAALTATWSLTTGDMSGKFETEPKTPKKDPRQQQADVLEYYNTYKINGYTKIAIMIPASTTVRYAYYPSATVDSGRALGNVAVYKDYAAPMISQPQQIQLTPAAAAALRA